MAKKKKVADDETGDVLVEEKSEKKARRGIEDIMIGANALIARKQIVIPVSPNIDLMLGGGVPEGSFVIPTGPPKLGKTTFGLQLAANAMNPKYDCELKKGGRTLYIFNIEGRLKRRDILGIHGLDPDRVKIIGSEPGRILSAEDYIDYGEQLINENPGDIFIFDSFSQLCTVARKNADVRDRFRDDTSLLLATFCKRICNVIPVNRSIVIGITHRIANQGARPGQSQHSEASGNKVQYAVDVKMAGTHTKPWMAGDAQIGQEVYWNCTSSALGGPGKCMSYLRYGYGIDKEAELVLLAADCGLLKRKNKDSNWYEFPDGQKMNGIDQARNLLISTKGMYEDMYGQIRTMLNMES